jgi:hypothetical protein
MVCMQAIVGVSERLFGTTPAFKVGAPKQFANFVGTAFAGLGALFLLLGPEHGVAYKWIGFFWLVGLCGATALNGVIDFCLGCVFFSLGIEFGIFPKSVYTLGANERPDITWTYGDLNKRLNEGAPKQGTKCASVAFST